MSVSLLPRGTTFARYCASIARCGGNIQKAAGDAGSRYGDNSAPAMILRGAVGAGSTRPDGSWGSALADFNLAAAEFFGLVRESSLLGRMSGLRRMPLGVQVLRSTAGASAYWVASGKSKPVTRMSFARDALPPLKIASLSVLTKELLFNADPASERYILADMVAAAREVQDLAFVDPANSGVAEERPASVTNGATTIAATGDPAADIAALIAAFPGDLASAYFVMHPTTAAGIGLSRDSGGSFQFADVGPRGGAILGIPVLTSRMVPIDSNGGIIALIDASGIAFGEGGSEVRSSDQASIEMSDTPGGDSVTPTGSSMVSLYQTNSTALLIEFETNWDRVRPGSVALIEGAAYA
ncbi:HK97 family phage major capsid protein [Panacagrimonas perspica]|uniref:HK97 family phage major capsid protein n=1 Tax=Panacagrimonas perspica TaxID=381431 RepID=A0A4S3K3N6_9GAMM|nr:phage major capsid protein [Panacagrimonas perspica]TDU31312.1 HK97 family phage major capsid protein [Panacagrimonas perspica]THD02653.1 hypothetical protein B1810_14010 [Panacagrimonas perspica]